MSPTPTPSPAPLLRKFRRPPLLSSLWWWAVLPLLAICPLVLKAQPGSVVVTPSPPATPSDPMGGGIFEFGEKVTLNAPPYPVSADHPQPTFIIEWKKDGVVIPGATAYEYEIAAATASDTGTYSATAWPSDYPTSNSGSAVVTIKPPAPPVIRTGDPYHDSRLTGQAKTFSVNATGSFPRSYQWFKDGRAIAGATDSLYRIDDATAADAGTYSVVVTNSLGSATSATANFTVFPATAPTLGATYPLDQSGSVHLDKFVSFYPIVSGGSDPFSYQWLKNGVAIPGATGFSLTINAPVLADAGRYSVIVTNAAGSVTSRAATLRIYFNSDPMILAQPATRSVFDGTSVSFSVAADGASTPSYRWQVRLANSASLKAWTDLTDANGYTGATTPTLAITQATAALNGNSYRCMVTTKAGSLASAAATLNLTTTRLVNISARAYCGTGNNVTIGGFVIAGTGSKRVLVRAVGPSLASQGLAPSEVMRDPTIEVHQGSPTIAANDNWGDNPNVAEIASVATQTGANPLAAGDTTSSALLLTLTPGVYSFVVSGRGGTSGIVLLEVYDADPGTPTARFANIATRAYSTPGNGVTIGGFVLAGKESKRVLLRGVGPTLVTLGLSQTEVLWDPAIELHRGALTLATNDSWRDSTDYDTIATTGTRIGATPLDSYDARSAALLPTLSPGAYSFIASGKANSSGIVLVEIYDAD